MCRVPQTANGKILRSSKYHSIHLCNFGIFFEVKSEEVSPLGLVISSLQLVSTHEAAAILSGSLLLGSSLATAEDALNRFLHHETSPDVFPYPDRMDLSSPPLSSSMLPSFQLRNIRPSSSTSPRASQSDLESSSSHEHLIEITAPEYDSTVSDHPEATLKYVDEDDGEVVTVGSRPRMFACHTNIRIQVGTSLELSERLREPIPKALERAQLYHLFDIDRKEHIVNIWQSFAERTTEVHSKDHLNESEFHRSSIQIQAFKPWGQDRRVSSVLHGTASEHVSHGFKYDEADDRHIHYIRACNPPQLQPYELRKYNSTKAPWEARYPFTLTSTYDQDVDVDKNAAAAIPLTREGKRKVSRVLDTPRIGNAFLG